jgi:hypothetical protein
LVGVLKQGKKDIKEIGKIPKHFPYFIKLKQKSFSTRFTEIYR